VLGSLCLPRCTVLQCTLQALLCKQLQNQGAWKQNVALTTAMYIHCSYVAVGSGGHMFPMVYVPYGSWPALQCSLVVACC
jgi:hypothetical protein